MIVSCDKIFNIWDKMNKIKHTSVIRSCVRLCMFEPLVTYMSLSRRFPIYYYDEKV